MVDGVRASSSRISNSWTETRPYGRHVLESRRDEYRPGHPRPLSRRIVRVAPFSHGGSRNCDSVEPRRTSFPNLLGELLHSDGFLAPGGLEHADPQRALGPAIVIIDARPKTEIARLDF